ncbi:Serine hydroxymethyltransferase, cytosolic [Friedmanniomyces endolithicus]|nr:Serine hydroxymethyltransferase, cytosolic [Friedmanniomyces endolithicus]
MDQRATMYGTMTNGDHAATNGEKTNGEHTATNGTTTNGDHAASNGSNGATPHTYALPKSHQDLMERSLVDTDPEIADIMAKEITRQRESILLIASENVTSRAVFDALGSPMSNKYSEGYPGARYYGGNEHIDEIEITCQNRALQTFGLKAEEWGVNVQPLSGSPANLQVYQAIMRPHERLMGLDLPHGGHLSHGYQTPTKKISAVSTYFETFPYRVNLETGLIDYDQLEQNALMYRPKVLVAGTSAYCREIDCKRMREIADKVGCYLMFDMAHISGLVAAGVNASPFEYCDIVTTTTHKSLRGPRGAMIFFRRGMRKTEMKAGKELQTLYDLEGPINFSVFPGHQGGPHNHTITALAVALKQAQTPEFKQYQQQVIKNAKQLERSLTGLGYKLVTDGTDNHMVLLDLKPQGLDGARVEAVLEQVNIACNKNTTPGDKSALSPCGVRIGAPAMTSRGMGEEDFDRIAGYIDRCVKMAKGIQGGLPKEGNKLKDFKGVVGKGGVEGMAELKKEIAGWAGTFPLPV